MKGILLATVLLVVAAGAPLSSADDGPPPELAAGHKVRLTPAGNGQGRFTGTVLEVQPDALLLRRVSELRPERVPLADLRRLEVAHGRRGHFKEGALIGFVPGFAFGAYAGNVLGCDDQGPECTSLDSALALGAITGGMTAVVGGLVGLAVRSDKWARVPIPASSRRPRLGAVVLPVRGGVGARLALSF